MRALRHRVCLRFQDRLLRLGTDLYRQTQCSLDLQSCPMPLVDHLMPALRLLDPETAHRVTVKGLAAGFGPRDRTKTDPALRQSVLGLDLSHPICLAAGFDKSAECWRGLLRVGAGAVEVGTLTPRPQAGNPKPRVFRLIEDEAVINRYGFNNDGLEAGLARLTERDRSLGVVGINVGINKDSEDPDTDYAHMVRNMAPMADYLTINVSSPNTGPPRPAGRGLLGRLLSGAKAPVTSVTANAPPIFLKIAPDLDSGQLEAIVETAIELIEGIISNTTVARPDHLQSHHAAETGGLSGPPLFDRSTHLLAQAYALAGGKIV